VLAVNATESGDPPVRRRRQVAWSAALQRLRRSVVLSAPITTWTKVSWFCRRILESVHITPHVIYAVLTQEALNPFIECTFGLLAVECLSITFKLGPKLTIEHI
jgi:hypothetical protein